MASYPRNGFGLHDMVGNVWQWLEDKVPDNDTSRVLRGGSWSSLARYLRASDRNDDGAGYRGYDVGFRVCRVSPIEKPVAGALPTESLITVRREAFLYACSTSADIGDTFERRNPHRAVFGCSINPDSSHFTKTYEKQNL